MLSPLGSILSWAFLLVELGAASDVTAKLGHDRKRQRSGLTKNGHAAAIPISRLGVVGSRNFLPLVLSRSDRSRCLSQESDAVAPQLVGRTGEITPAVGRSRDLGLVPGEALDNAPSVVGYVPKGLKHGLPVCLTRPGCAAVVFGNVHVSQPTSGRTLPSRTWSERDQAPLPISIAAGLAPSPIARLRLDPWRRASRAREADKTWWRGG